MTTAGAADDELDGKETFLRGRIGRSIQTREEKIRSLMAKLLCRLAHDGESGAVGWRRGRFGRGGPYGWLGRSLKIAYEACSGRFSDDTWDRGK